jgi:hypothetical protein
MAYRPARKCRQLIGSAPSLAGETKDLAVVLREVLGDPAAGRVGLWFEVRRV